MTTPFSIRRAVPQDLAAIAAVENSCFDDDAFSRRQLNYLLCKAQGACYVACCGEQIVGYLSLLTRRTISSGRIYSAAVSPAARSAGIGQALFEAAFAHARRLGLSSLTLEVRVDNVRAEALYRRMGFTADHLLKSYYHDGTDGWHMTLRLV
ncbi:MAG: ribosomal protein S18-alanine N-acetyltransferase [Alistipes sp.]